MASVAEMLIAGARFAPRALNREEMAAVVEAYFSSYDRDDVEQRVGLFADAFVFEDPAGVRRAEEKESLRAFYEGLRRNSYSLHFSQQASVSTGNCTLVRATVEVQVGTVGSASIDLYALFEVDDEGKIVSLRTFFDEDCIAD
jgi:limonene-1,2-epoxide hydrolase